jgi:hypothetical protein
MARATVRGQRVGGHEREIGGVATRDGSEGQERVREEREVGERKDGDVVAGSHRDG